MVWDFWWSSSIWLTKMTGGWLTFVCCLRWSERVNDSKQSLQTCFRSPVWHLNDLSVMTSRTDVLILSQFPRQHKWQPQMPLQLIASGKRLSTIQPLAYKRTIVLMATSEHKFCITFSKVMAEIPYVGLQMRRLLICFPTIFVMTFVTDYLNTWIPSIQLS